MGPPAAFPLRGAPALRAAPGLRWAADLRGAWPFADDTGRPAAAAVSVVAGSAMPSSAVRGLAGAFAPGALRAGLAAAAADCALEPVAPALTVAAAVASDAA